MSESTTTASPVSAPTTRRPFVPRRFVIAVAAAVVLNGIIFLIASSSGAAMIVTQPQETQITVLVAMIATAVPLAIGGVVTWFVARKWPVFRTIAAWVGLGVAALSSLSPVLVTSDTASGIALGAMHLIAGIAWFVAVLKPRA